MLVSIVTSTRSVVARLGLVAAIAAFAGATVAAEDAYPSRPVKIALMMAPGNGLDIATRNFADMLAKELGQPVVVDNRPGANGIIAFQSAKSAPADGYTLLVGSSSPMTIVTAMDRPVPYDPFKDFKPVAGMLRAVGLLTVPADSKLTSISDLAKVSKAKPLSIATYSDSYALGGLQLGEMAGAQLLSVPYKGYNAILQDLVGGRVDIAFGDAFAPQELIKAGKLRPLAVTGKTRIDAYPNIPTVAESGLPDYSFYTWDIFLVRSETPAPIAAKLGAAISRVMNGREWPAYLRANGGSETMRDSPPEIQRMLENEVDLYRTLAAKMPKTAQ